MNEKRLIKECQKGNEEAFNQLISFYYPFVYKFLLKMISNEEAAKDLTQETFIKLIRNIDKYNINKNNKFSTYLITIARNTCLDYIKKNNKIIYMEDINDIITTKNNDNTIYEEIDKLTNEQKIAVKLKYIEGYTIEEIALALKEKPQTIKSRLYEARKKLKENIRRNI